MFYLGLLLLGSIGAFTGLVLADNWSGGPDYTVSVLGNDIATMNSVAIFVSGIILALVAVLAAAMTLGGGARLRRRTGEHRRLRAEARQAVADRDALQDRMDRPAAPMPTAEAPRTGDEAPAAHGARSHSWFRFRHGH